MNGFKVRLVEKDIFKLLTDHKNKKISQNSKMTGMS